MGGMIQIFILTCVFSAIVYYLYKMREKQVSQLSIATSNSFDKLVEINLLRASEMTKLDTTLSFQDVEAESSRQIVELNDLSFKECVYGDPTHKRVVTTLFREITSSELTTLEAINNIIDFSDLPNLSFEHKFAILVDRLGFDIFYILDEKYNITSLKMDSRCNIERRFIDEELLDTIFSDMITETSLDYKEALDLMATLVYQSGRGYGIIDKLTELNIDGFEVGTSGSRRCILEGDYTHQFPITRSCWVQIKTTWIHLYFVDFGTEDEIRRLTLLISGVKGSKPLVKNSAIKVVEFYDGSRISAARPPVGYGYYLFFRKFNSRIRNLIAWLDNGSVFNYELVIRLLTLMLKAFISIIITGLQNSGKTTFVKSLIACFPQDNVRPYEMSFESEANEIYPYRNIAMFKPTQYQNNELVLDFLKKVDGTIGYNGEVAENVVACNYLQQCQVGYVCSITTNHSNDSNSLIRYFAGAATAVLNYSDDRAYDYTLDSIKFNCKIGFVGKLRVVEYIEEIIKIPQDKEYPEVPITDNVVDAINAMSELQRENFTRVTDRKKFETRRILFFNKETMTYQAGEWMTPESTEKILQGLGSEELIKEFLDLMHEGWGI